MKELWLVLNCCHLGGFSSYCFIAPPFCLVVQKSCSWAVCASGVFELQLLNYCFWFQSFPEVLIHHLTSHPGAIVTSSSMSSTPIRLVSLRMASTLSFGTRQDAGSLCRASGYCCSAHSTTGPTGRLASVGTSPPPRVTFCWAVTGWCQPRRYACPRTPSRMGLMLWLFIGALLGHHQQYRWGSRPKACWMR